MWGIGDIKSFVPLADTIASYGIKLKRDGNEYKALCPFHVEDTPSFTVYRSDDGTERYHCFGCGESGDVINFVERIKGVTRGEAIRMLGGETAPTNVAPRQIAHKDPYAGIVPIDPIGEIKTGVPVKLYNPKRGTWGQFIPEAVYPYRRADGSLIGYVLRRSLKDGGKETPQVMRVRLAEGKDCWCRFPFPKPRPLYNAHIVEKANQVIVVEGEKCADALATVAKRCSVTWPGGANGVAHADWSALDGKDVIIWPDADQPGLDAAHEIASRLNARRIRIMDVADKPKGWDVADAIAEGWGKEEIDSFMRDRVRDWDPPSAGNADLVEVRSSGTATVPAVPSRGYPDFVPASYPVDLFEREPWCNHPLFDWCFVTSDNIFYNWKTGEKMGRQAFDLAMDRAVPEFERLTDKGAKIEKPAPSAALVKRMGGKVVAGVMYHPRISSTFFEWEGKWWVNSFSPSSVPDADPNWESHPAWRVCCDHIQRIFPDGAKTIIQWMAWNTQRPGEKINWAVVLVGPEGAGKTAIAGMQKAAMGRLNVQEISEASLFSDFTGWAEGACVRIMEEIRVQGETRSAVMNKLKPYITNQTVEVVRKGENGREVLNVTNYMALTNFRDALAVTEGDRRWAIWSTPWRTKAEAEAAIGDKAAYFRPIWDAINNHPEVIRGWLLSVDLSDFDPYSPPEMTDAKREMIELARSPMDADMREALAIGGEGIGQDVLSTWHLSAAIKEISGRQIWTTALANLLIECGWTKFDKLIKWRGRPYRVYYRQDMVPSGLSEDELMRHLRNRLDLTGES